ncbi:hypothetical protein COHA_006091 [Chlorella ohadii]|uniref:Uncharacterized protein n=1 Tax=Chlorella ohadii TaxID=2649997 RepID=A0AAD5DQ01_9CHLO|nr:hypothetical protein COHA_006091 [Chlorella ohadii]
MSAAGRASFQALFKTAEQLQQRAERKRGAQAAELHSQAVAKYKEALALAASGAAAPPADDFASALFNCAECLQEGAEATVAACAALPDGQLTLAAVQAADAQAAALLDESVATYRRVLDNGQPRVDALVCCANALSSWAEVAARSSPAQAAQLLGQAGEAYRAALQREEDALTWSNLADALVQHAALCCEAGQGEQGGRLFGEAMQAYQRACGLSDAADGDDVPGLLINWSRGLLTMAQQAQDPTLAVRLLDEAAQRLRQSCDFLRGSDEPLLALGDVLLERGEQLATAGDAAGAAASLQRAVEEGYRQAQRISASSPEAAVGLADVAVQQARLAAAAGDAGAAAQAWAAAEAGYAAALQQPEAFDLEARSALRYNHACCLARCGRASEAAGVLRSLLALGTVSAADVAADADLAGVPL